MKAQLNKKKLVNGTDVVVPLTCKETDPTVPDWAKTNTKPIYNGNDIKYTGATGSVVTNDTTINVALKAIDDTIGNVETLLANI